MSYKFRLSQKTYKRLTILVSILILVSSGAISYYFLIYSDPNSDIALPTPRPTATPTPPYLPFLKQRANYVGKITKVENENSVTLLRDDGSKVILELKPNIPIYVVKGLSDTNPIIDITNQKVLKEGDTISIYTNTSNDIIAIFLHEKN